MSAATNASSSLLTEKEVDALTLSSREHLRLRIQPTCFLQQIPNPKCHVYPNVGRIWRAQLAGTSGFVGGGGRRCSRRETFRTQ